MTEAWDVIVAGSGNAGLCAAHAARQAGARVLMLEKGAREWAGGNSAFTAGAFRTAHAGLEDLRPLVEDDERAAHTELAPYPPDAFSNDMERVTEGRCDPELTRAMIGASRETMGWLREKGVRFRLMYDRQSHLVGGLHRFWGGLVLGTVGGGEGLVAQHLAAAERDGVEVRHQTGVVDLRRDRDGRVAGVVVRAPDGRTRELAAGAVVLAAGGFEADPRMRATYLGPNWDVAKVRGTPHNTGEVLTLALAAGAQPVGHWSGCHAIAWDAGAGATGDRALGNLPSKQSYPFGLVVNRDGRRFLDEGADFRNYTYAKYGAEILRQPGAIAWQLFDARTEALLHADEYTAPSVQRTSADSVAELAERAGIDRAGLVGTVEAFNAAVQPGELNPAVKDGNGTLGLTPPKSNWALPLDSPPFLAFRVTCGITFTFGGLRIDPDDARVLDRAGRPLPGLFAAGELVGGLFFHNYPGGTGLTSGAVFGRRAGSSAAVAALEARALAV